jgi:tetratricopeptide (TPR) repeat protein
MFQRWMNRGPWQARFLRRPLRESIDRIVRFHERRAESDLAAAWQTLKSGVTYQCLAYDNDHRYRKAEESFMHSLTNDRTNAVAQTDLGQCYEERAVLLNKLGYIAECFAEYEKAIKVRSQDWSLWRDAAWAMADVPEPGQRDLERAMSLARQAVDGDSQDPLSWRILGSVQYRSGEWTQAAESLNKAIQLQDGESGAREYLFLAMAYWQQGNAKEARQLYRAAIWRMKGEAAAPDIARYRSEAAILLFDEPAPIPARKPNSVGKNDD